MKKIKIRKRMKTDEWNERNRDLEEEKTKGDDNDWDKKEAEDEERSGTKNDFHEENYDK